MSTSHAVGGSGGEGPVSFDHLPPRWEPTPVRPRLPVGVAVISILISLFAVVMVLGGILYLLAMFAGNFVPMSLVIFPTIDVYGAAILVVLGASLLGVATALWRQETWALWTTIVLVFATSAYLFFTDSITILFLILVVLFIYLISVRRFFY